MKRYKISVIKQFEYYKKLSDDTFSQLENKDIQWQYNSESNSIAIIVKHLVGNMLSRWTNFLTEDGEKDWRHRDTEFEYPYFSKDDMIDAWDKGWDCLFSALKPLQDDDFERIIHIRNQGHTVTEAINRQLGHYSYHIGQIVFLGKMIKGEHWESLSIPKENSSEFNKDKFTKDKERKHFTDNL